MTGQPETSRQESFRIDGSDLMDKAKQLVDEGNKHRLVVRNEHGNDVFDIPLTVAVVGGIIVFRRRQSPSSRHSPRGTRSWSKLVASDAARRLASHGVGLDRSPEADNDPTRLRMPPVRSIADACGPLPSEVSGEPANRGLSHQPAVPLRSPPFGSPRPRSAPGRSAATGGPCRSDTQLAPPAAPTPLNTKAASDAGAPLPADFEQRRPEAHEERPDPPPSRIDHAEHRRGPHQQSGGNAGVIPEVGRESFQPIARFRR